MRKREPQPVFYCYIHCSACGRESQSRESVRPRLRLIDLGHLFLRIHAGECQIAGSPSNEDYRFPHEAKGKHFVAKASVLLAACFRYKMLCFWELSSNAIIAETLWHFSTLKRVEKKW